MGHGFVLWGTQASVAPCSAALFRDDATATPATIRAYNGSRFKAYEPQSLGPI